MARRGRKRGEEPGCHVFLVIEEANGPLGPERLSRSTRDPRLTHRVRGFGASQTHEWFVDGLPVTSREATDAALLLPPPPGTEPPPRPEPSAEDREALRRFIQALAIDDARRDHKAEMAKRAKAVRPSDNA